MSDQSRLFIAAILMMGVLLVSWFISGNRGGQPSNEPVLVAENAVDESSTEESSLPVESVPEEEYVDPETQDDMEPESNYTEESITVIIPDEEGEILVSAQISTTGGAVTSWELAQYDDFPDQELHQAVRLSAEPWLVSVDNSGTPIQFTYEGPDTVYAGMEPVELVLESPGGTKTFEFTENYYGFFVEKDGPGLDMNTSVSPGAIPITETNAPDRGYFTASWYTNGHNKSDARKIEGLEPAGNVSWVAVSNKYFTVILMPATMVRADGYIAPGLGGSPEVSIDDNSVKVYAGPKSYTQLSQLGGSQTDMIDFGWPVIRWIGKLIFIFLTSVLSFVSNWGMRIIILAFTLKIILSPLTTKSYVSMQKMQKIQPAMKEIQAKYAKDPKQQQVEMQKLYKESGVNPLGGCLPILLQMPVFFAMYRVLANMVELRGQGFLLWINDLSRPEILIPFGTKLMGLEGIGLMALLLGVIMFLQQKLTGSSTAGAAGQQQKMMMYMMPFFMMFLFMRFASGLTLYWMVFNVLTLVHQEIIKKRLIDE